MESKELTLQDLQHRLRILERTLGLEPEIFSCQGKPLDCLINPCTEKQCPIRNNIFQELQRRCTKIEKDIQFLRLYLEENNEASQETLKIVELRLLREQLKTTLTEIQETIKTAPNSMFLITLFKETIQKIEKVDSEILNLRERFQE